MTFAAEGKTYTYRNTSSKAFVISGGRATPATLFYNLATRKIGIGLARLTRSQLDKIIVGLNKRYQSQKHKHLLTISEAIWIEAGALHQ